MILVVKVWLEESCWRPLLMNGSSQTKWTSGLKWKEKNVLNGETMERNWGSLSKTNLWNYRKTGTCLHDWWWSPKVVLKSTTKRLSDSISFPVVRRSLFANDGTMFCCSIKCALMRILEKTHESLDTSSTETALPPQLYPQWRLLSSMEGQNFSLRTSHIG